MAVAVACAKFVTELVRVRQRFSFRPGTQENAIVCFVAIEIVKLAHAIARDLERKEVRAGRRMTFGTGVALSFFFLLVGAGLLLR
jgi:hypothetical protein